MQVYPFMPAFSPTPTDARARTCTSSRNVLQFMGCYSADVMLCGSRLMFHAIKWRRAPAMANAFKLNVTSMHTVSSVATVTALSRFHQERSIASNVQRGCCENKFLVVGNSVSNVSIFHQLEGSEPALRERLSSQLRLYDLRNRASGEEENQICISP